MAALTRDAEVLAHAGDAGAVEAVLTALRNFRGDPKVSAACVHALASLVVSCDERNCARACASVADVFETLVATMSTLPDQRAVRFCTMALAWLAGHNADAGCSAVAAGTLPALVAALRSTSDTAADFGFVLAAVSGLLWRQSFGDRALAGPLYDTGVVEATIPGMRAYPSDAEVQRSACALLHLTFNKAEDDAGQQNSFAGSSGAVDAVVTAMRTHRADAEVQAAGCEALSALRRRIEEPDETWMEHSGCLDVVLTAMRTHRTCREVVGNACNALASALRRSPSAADQDRAVAAGGLVAVVAVWRTHAADADLLVACAGALACMLLSNPRHIAAALSAGVAELTLTALRAHQDANRFHKNAYILLFVLLTGGPAPDLEVVRRLLAAGALQLATRPGALQSEARDEFVSCLQAVAEDAERAAECAAAELLADGGGSARSHEQKEEPQQEEGRRNSSCRG